MRHKFIGGQLVYLPLFLLYNSVRKTLAGEGRCFPEAVYTAASFLANSQGIVAGPEQED